MSKYKISYKKTFISGHLKGLTVDAYFTVPGTELQRNCNSLFNITERNPGREACTNNKFYVTNVAWDEV